MFVIMLQTELLHILLLKSLTGKKSQNWNIDCENRKKK